MRADCTGALSGEPSLGVSAGLIMLFQAFRCNIHLGIELPRVFAIFLTVFPMWG